ncbi:alpha/beta hydrolase [Brevundimonas sp.]|uniref:alpha/beta hydrolase n=1 Tax=Brevundimonas sp. TaxID=1871086 RepID=UPI002600BBFC|nr:alpha/beta hydrolase [Brevundimonas sp.]
MSRRSLLSLAAGAVAPLAAACSPLALMETLSPRDRGARRIAANIAYGAHERQKLDLYAPVVDGTWPVVVFFYGGGWNSGSKDNYGWAAQALAAKGFLVALPDYRLVPAVRFPHFIEDAAAATAHVQEIAGAHGGRPDRLAVGGHSAGAHLAMMIALDPRYLGAAGAPDAIRAAFGISGPYEFLPFDVASSINAFGQAPDPLQTQPITFASADAPPLWLGHGTGDETVHAEDAELLAEAVNAAGGRAELELYPGVDHATTIAAFSPLFRSRVSTLADVTAFLRRTLG